MVLHLPCLRQQTAWIQLPMPHPITALTIGAISQKKKKVMNGKRTQKDKNKTQER